MPLSEVHQASKKRRAESTHSNLMASYPSDLSSFIPENEVVELLWDNGQLVMQGQSSKTRKSSLSSVLPYNGKLEEKDYEEDAALLKFGQAGANPVVSDLPPTVPCAPSDSTAPWMNYPIDDALQNDYCTEFFTEFAGAPLSYLQTFRSSPGNPEPSRNRNNILLDTPKQNPTCSETAKPSALDTAKKERDALNLSHHSGPSAEPKNRDKSCNAASSYPMESTLVDPSYSSNERARARLSSLLDSRSGSPERLNRKNSNFAASVAAERNETKRVPEAVVASSSVCSGYRVGAASDEQNHKPKHSIRKREDFGEHSDDPGDEFIDGKKPEGARVPGSKRTRTAEVHNLSERRRRDRINEKMKALQELIPNCNKVDKASMLDEAIEYLKTLQVQVQMMSMGTGLCLPPMVLPAGMSSPHMHPPPISPFSPSTMGMGLGFGMGMIDLNCPPGLIPFPFMGGTHFPCPPLPSASALPRMPPSSSIHSIGIPGQRLPIPVPFAPQGAMLNPMPVPCALHIGPSNQQQQYLNLEAVAPPMQEGIAKTLQASRTTAINPLACSSKTTETVE